MRPSLKIGISTLVTSLLVWGILEVIAILRDMHLRPMFTIILFVMGLVGLVIITISTASYHMKRQDKKYKLVLWVMFEMVMVIVIIAIFFLGISLMPLESLGADGLKIDYFNGQDPYISKDFDFLFYR